MNLKTLSSLRIARRYPTSEIYLFKNRDLHNKIMLIKRPQQTLPMITESLK